MELGPGVLVACPTICLDLPTAILTLVERVPFKELNPGQSDIDMAAARGGGRGEELSSDRQGG